MSKTNKGRYSSGVETLAKGSGISGASASSDEIVQSYSRERGGRIEDGYLRFSKLSALLQP